MPTQGHITPEDVFRESADNPILRHCIECWKHGHVTWDQAMMTAAVYLARQNVDLTKEAVRNWAMSPPSSIVVQIGDPIYSDANGVPCRSDGAPYFPSVQKGEN